MSISSSHLEGDLAIENVKTLRITFADNHMLILALLVHWLLEI
jgi:hypothetical protein